MSMFHIRFGVLVSSLGLLAACGKSTPVQEPKPTATVLSAEVTHGETANDYRIAWETEPSDAAVTIEWSDTPTFEPGSGVAIDVNAGASELSWTADGEPQRRYFSITPENGESVLVAARLLPLEGGRNFRDLGGYETEDGRMVK